MISPACEEWIQENFDDSRIKNKYTAEYIRREMAARKICPICKKLCLDYTHLNYHISNEHTEDEIETNMSVVENALDPIQRLRETILVKKNKDPKIVSIGSYFGDIITSKDNQHAMINIIGKTGTGKSNAAMHIGECVSQYVAKKIGGVPSDYFNIDNIAIMRMDAIIDILKKLDSRGKSQVYVFDDIGGEWNARNSQSKPNKAINEIIQTFRDTNSIVIFTMPDSFLIDKVGRKLAHYQIEMQYKMFNYEMSVGKIKQIAESYQKGVTYYMFPVVDGIKYEKILFRRASKELVAEYEAKREITRKKFTKESIKKLKEVTDPEGAKADKPIKLNKYQEIAPLVNQLRMDNPEISIRSIADQLKVNKQTVSSALKFNAGEL